VPLLTSLKARHGNFRGSFNKMTESEVPNQAPLPSYPVLEMILNAIADRVKRYRYAVHIEHGLTQWEHDEVKAIARELGVNPSELSVLASKGRTAADLLKKMLAVLHVDVHHRVVHDMERLCKACVEKIRCERELSAGTAAFNFREFCPNAVTLDALSKPSGTATNFAS
jgi:hypothetical protein